jgi:ribosomal protein L29
MGPPTGPTPPDQMDENPAQIAIIKKQIASLIDTATQLTTAMNQNEAGIKNNTALIQKVMQSQTDLNTKLDSMKKAQ